ncbi:MAG TPA: hypothetical protein VFD92_21340 [Candidatus Binatia bacterium]|nr:hypothetical protein [Candidatus Binatia bacterium]
MSPIALALALAIVAAVAAVAWKQRERARAERALAERPGATLQDPIAIRSFDEMDSHLRLWRCGCGSRPALVGEGTREVAERRFRVAHLRCDACETDSFVYFETTALLQ